MTHSRKASALLALLAVLAAAVAAPYMIPENPDSAVFRSGVFAAVLLGAAYLPARRALARAPRRALACGLMWGFLFAAALSLGSELLVYDGLLPGLGPAVRRAAVPLLAAPLIGLLTASLLACRPAERKRAPRAPAWAFALALLVCWLPVWLAYFPAMLNYDFPGQYGQHLSGTYSRLHPLLHSLLCNGVITLGERLAGRTFGLFLMAALQAALLALALGDACAFAGRQGAPRAAVLAMAALFALHPIFPVMAFSMTKDTLFGAALLALSLRAWSLLQDPDAFLRSPRRWASFALLCVCTALLRNNGVFALALLLPGVVVACRGRRARAALLCAASALCCVAVDGALSLALHPEAMQSFQLYSVPAQQLVRANARGEMSPEDREALRSWYTGEAGLHVRAHLADGAKGYLDRERLQSEGGEFLALWARNAGKNARVYAEAFLMLNVGAWYPDDLSYASIYRDASYVDKGYLQTQEYDMSGDGLVTRCLLPAVRDAVERVCRRNALQKIPLLSLLLCTATPLWVIVFSCAALLARRRARLLPAALPALGVWLSYLFGPCTLARYIFPLFCAAPPLLLAALSAPASEEARP